MGSKYERQVQEIEKEISQIPEVSAQKSKYTMDAEQELCSGALYAMHNKTLWSMVYNSIRVVIFSNWLNLLMPLGPLAIIVEIWTDHRVSCSRSFNRSSFNFFFVVYAEM